jgi:hypothetical protein
MTRGLAAMQRTLTAPGLLNERIVRPSHTNHVGTRWGWPSPRTVLSHSTASSARRLSARVGTAAAWSMAVTMAPVRLACASPGHLARDHGAYCRQADVPLDAGLGRPASGRDGRLLPPAVRRRWCVCERECASANALPRPQPTDHVAGAGGLSAPRALLLSQPDGDAAIRPARTQPISCACRNASGLFRCRPPRAGSMVPAAARPPPPPRPPPPRRGPAARPVPWAAPTARHAFA